MEARPEPELLDVLIEPIDPQLWQTGTDRAFVMQLCSEAIAFSWTLPRGLDAGHVGQRARSAALLLLELGVPEVNARTRRELAVACELIAIGSRREIPQQRTDPEA